MGENGLKTLTHDKDIVVCGMIRLDFIDELKDWAWFDLSCVTNAKKCLQKHMAKKHSF